MFKTKRSFLMVAETPAQERSLTIMPCLASDGVVGYYFNLDDVFRLLQLSEEKRLQYLRTNSNYAQLNELRIRHARVLRSVNNDINLFNLRGDCTTKIYECNLQGSVMYEAQLRKDCEKLLAEFRVLDLLDWMHGKQWQHRWQHWTCGLNTNPRELEQNCVDALLFINELELSYLIFENGLFRDQGRSRAVVRVEPTIHSLCKWIIVDLMTRLRNLSKLNLEHIRSIKIMRFNERELNSIEENFVRSMGLLREKRDNSRGPLKFP